MSRSRIFQFDDPQQYGPAIRAANIEMFPTSAARFHSELVQCDLGSVWMQHMAEDAPRVCYGAVNPSRTIIEFLTGETQAPIRHSGVEVFAGEIIINDAGATHRRSFGPCRFGTMSLDNDHFASLGYKMLGRDVVRPKSMVSYRPDQGRLAALQELHEAATQLARTAPATLAHPEIARALEQGLARAMIHCFADFDDRAQFVNARQSAVIARLEQVLALRPDKPVYLAEICAETGISERTLRIYCHEFLGMGPTRYLWLRRMHLARAALRRASAASSSVTRVATDYGFWELGRFAVQYRRLFGESPSQTLSQPPIDFRPLANRPFLLPPIH